MKNADSHGKLRLWFSKLKFMETQTNQGYGKLTIAYDVEECYHRNKG
jgi:hypothetical protein